MTYRKTIGNSHDNGDLVIDENEPNSIIWAIGRLASPGGRRGKKSPSFHHTYPKTHVQLNLKEKPAPGSIYECKPFVKSAAAQMRRRKVENDKINPTRKTWGPHR